MFGFKNARIEALEAENDTLSHRLAAEKQRAVTSGRALSEALDERDAARLALQAATAELGAAKAEIARIKRTGNGNLIPGGPKALAKRQAAATH